ncbi:uncharacterized protein LOC110229295 [Arabidopsis lyrata subsp. lyrata]|uniref:uncharacterized protein LOC110229295 n=1 Tax=Arabidopsis lyrata subsp. lyrata TaxID=81972 RepID=UPI000A29E119|nr:uncharacterized protein LOC110229295 [Arabidopsis lyrata subsp. lyrata]|eukprot:XP_020884729.1 uncharacterized protein LOC110229295 [Arabidopsis lyrata subsp. lyrata]
MAASTVVLPSAKDPPDPTSSSSPIDPVTLTIHRSQSSHLVSAAAPPILLSPFPVAGQASVVTDSEISDNLTSVTAPLLSDGSVPLTTSSTPSLEKEEELEIPPVIHDTQLLWAARFKSNLRNLKKVSLPTFTEDGTPKVRAPASVILRASDTWKDHIVAHFHGNPPPPGKIFTDLNPIWGTDGRIHIKALPNGPVLIFIPSELTRQWVLEVGCWQAGNCLFTVTAWSPTATLTPIKLVSLPIWVIIKDVPPQLYSLPGLSTIASGIGEPLHTEKHQLPPLAPDTRIKVEILLTKVLPSSVLVVDDEGNELRVWVEYPRLPPKCDFCNEYGHLYHRCPVAPDISLPPSLTFEKVPPQAKVNPIANVTLRVQPPPRKNTLSHPVLGVPASGPPSVTPPSKLSTQATSSNPNHIYLASPPTVSNDWQVVKSKSKHPSNKEKNVEVAAISQGPSVSSAQFAEEEEAIQIGQRIIRRRSGSPFRCQVNQPNSTEKEIIPLSSLVILPAVAPSCSTKQKVVAAITKKTPSTTVKNSTRGRRPGKGRSHHLA